MPAGIFVKLKYHKANGGKMSKMTHKDAKHIQSLADQGILPEKFKETAMRIASRKKK